MFKRPLITYCFAILLVGAFLILTGCQSQTPSPMPAVTAEREEGEALPVAAFRDSDPAVIAVIWTSSPHANTFVSREDGTNSDCARCHAPVQWVPSMDDLPESCYSCKFEVDPPPPYIAEDQWSHVECKVCHEVKKDVVNKEYAWLEIAAIGEYSKLSSPTELCLKCHLGVDVAGHAAVEVAGAHTELTCTQCHDPHTNTATCVSSGCHEDLSAKEIAGHDDDHSQIACFVCHDGGGMDIDRDASGKWGTYLTVEAGGESLRRSFTSHDTVKAAACERCHFAGNPWNLVEEVK